MAGSGTVIERKIGKKNCHQSSKNLLPAIYRLLPWHMHPPWFGNPLLTAWELSISLGSPNPPSYCTPNPFYTVSFSRLPCTTSPSQWGILGAGPRTVAFGGISDMQGIHKCMWCHSLPATKGYFVNCQRNACGIAESREKLSVPLLNWHSTHATLRWQSIIKLPYFFALYSCHHLKFSLACSSDTEWSSINV